MIRLHLARHGRTVAHGTFYGHDDVALDETGRRQAAAQAEALAGAGLRAVWSSDLARARDGALGIAAPHGVAVVEAAELREMCLGVLEGIPHADALARHPELAGRSYHDMLDVRFPGGGESVRDVSARVLPWLDRALQDVVRTAPPGPRVAVALVAHNTVTRVVLARAVGLGPEGYVRFAQQYGALSRIDLPVHGGAHVDWGAAIVAYSNRSVTP